MQDSRNTPALSMDELSDIDPSKLADLWSVMKSDAHIGIPKAFESSQCGTINHFSRALSAPFDLENEIRQSFANIDEVEETKGETQNDLKVASWNIAAPNNNPFEFWVAHNSAEYNDLMLAIQKFIDHPGPVEPRICSIFTPQMYGELRAELASNGACALDRLDEVWTNELMGRFAISEFLKDRSLGEKRLISMPDRMTSSIETQGRLIFRPSPITCAQDEMNDVETWWRLWMA